MNCKNCKSYAINHHLHGRDGRKPDLCDVCYWRDEFSCAREGYDDIVTQHNLLLERVKELEIVADLAARLDITETCAENKRLRDIICRASTKFCNYAQVQVTRETRFAILGDASKSNSVLSKPPGLHITDIYDTKLKP